MTDSIWTDEKIDELETLWNSGLSAYEIGLRMKISKNAIVGKVRREGMAFRRAPKGQTIPTLDPLYWKTESDGCMYAIGDPGTVGFKFCNAEIHKKSLCLEHFNICWEAPKKRPPGPTPDNRKYNFNF